MKDNPVPLPGTVAEDKAHFCPTCGGASVKTSPLVGTASCTICSWAGKIEELATFRFSHDLGTPDAIAQTFFMDMRQMLGQHMAGPLAQFLGKWGFIDTPTPKNAEKVRKHLARYIGRCAGAFVRTIIEVRAEIEKEEHSLGN